MDPLLSKYQCGLRKGFSAQNCLLVQVEIICGLRKGIWCPNDWHFKSFWLFSHEIIIAKLNGYGFSLQALKLTHNCFVQWKQRTQRSQISQAYSSWKEILIGVPRGSIRGPILFKIFLIDLFLVVLDIDFAIYADNNSIFPAGESIDDLVLSLQEPSQSFLRWFSDDQIKSNSDESHLTVSTYDVAKNL